MLTLLEELLSQALVPHIHCCCLLPREWLGFTSAGFSLLIPGHVIQLSACLLQSHKKQEWLLQSLVSLLETGAFALSSWAGVFYPQKVSELCQYHSDFPFWPPVVFGVNCSC